MERIASLIEQLQQAVINNAPASQLLVLSNMLQAELEQVQQKISPSLSTQKVAVVFPSARGNVGGFQKPIETVIKQAEIIIETPPEKTVEVLHVNEEEVEAELEEIRLKAEYAKKNEARQMQHKPVLLFDEEPEIPTLMHQPNYNTVKKVGAPKEVNEAVTANGASLNEKLKQGTLEIAEKLTENNAVKDLKKAIGINDRFVFINELFRGDEIMYERSIKTINAFSIYAEAQYWIERELKVKIGWDDSKTSTQEFYSLVKRRFS